ncbi:VOC family protein [Salinifilum aidingensis]
MTTSVIPNLWFDGQAEQAAHFYTSVFPRSRVVAVTRFPEGAPRPAGSVMTVEFVLDGHRFIALNGGPEFTFNEAVSFQVPCATQDEIDYYWRRLTEGGRGGPCGWLTDRFGLSWQIVPTVLEELVTDPDPQRARRATEAMLGMGKLDIAALQRAAEGQPA